MASRGVQGDEPPRSCQPVVWYLRIRTKQFLGRLLHVTVGCKTYAPGADVSPRTRRALKPQHDCVVYEFQLIYCSQDLEGKQWQQGDELLDFHAFQADESLMHRHPLFKCACLL